MVDENPSESEIRWAIGDGITALLHEIGHHKVRYEESAKTQGEALTLIDEAKAWVWAEATAHREGIWFDYVKADKYFASHAGGMPVCVRWRFRR